MKFGIFLLTSNSVSPIICSTRRFCVVRKAGEWCSYPFLGKDVIAAVSWILLLRRACGWVGISTPSLLSPVVTGSCEDPAVKRVAGLRGRIFGSAGGAASPRSGVGNRDRAFRPRWVRSPRRRWCVVGVHAGIRVYWVPLKYRRESVPRQALW